MDGQDLRELDLDAYRRQIGIVYQESFLFSNTVAANIAFGHPHATMEQIEQAAKIASAHDFITALPHGYETVLGESGVDLSGGQRQRLALARALILQPPILILDDPTASVDARTENEIVSALREAMTGPHDVCRVQPVEPAAARGYDLGFGGRPVDAIRHARRTGASSRAVSRNRPVADHGFMSAPPKSKSPPGQRREGRPFGARGDHLLQSGGGARGGQGAVAGQTDPADFPLHQTLRGASATGCSS